MLNLSPIEYFCVESRLLLDSLKSFRHLNKNYGFFNFFFLRGHVYVILCYYVELLLVHSIFANLNNIVRYCLRLIE